MNQTPTKQKWGHKYGAMEKWGQAPFCTINYGYGGLDESSPCKIIS